MSGIYLHIPFCKNACHYCDFHFSTSLKLKEPLIQALIKEIELRKNELGQIETIYFGGGTPSLLDKNDLEKILNAIRTHFSLSPSIQITLEANPDDLSEQKLKDLKAAGINRLSIGVQSFYEEDLDWMNRSHNAKQASHCLEMANSIGFDEINLDLIFGFPLLSDEKLMSNLNQALELKVQHISAYSMTVEDKTALAYQIKKGITENMKEGQAARQYKMIMNYLKDKGWEHYEISNFCQPGFRSRHNTSYWQNKNYLGIGPSAHGYLHPKRYWNIANNAEYIKQISEGNLAEESEILEEKDQYNEYLMTRLRLKEGINKEDFLSKFDLEEWESLEKLILKHQNYYVRDDSGIRLNDEGKLLADYLISELFRV